MKSKQSDYHSYLLRIWRVEADEDTWRASLEEVQTGELHGFTDLADLAEFLESVTGTEAKVEVHPELPAE